MLDLILNLIYPNTCGFCNKICKESLCKKCEISLKKYEIQNNVGAGLAKPKNYEQISLFKYESIIREKIIEYKFQDKPYLYKTFAKTILKNKKICGFLEKYDIIIPVPIHKKRKQERGYNQTELIAKEISKNIINLTFKKDIIFKIKDIEPQSKLTKNQRKENIKNAFEINKKEEIKNKNILLFDDIYTTGSTVNECSRKLKQAGAKNIGVLTVAKD